MPIYHCYHLSDYYIQMGSEWRHVNVSGGLRGKVATRQVSTTTTTSEGTLAAVTERPSPVSLNQTAT